MKKLVIILSAIALLAVSCGQSQQVKTTNDSVKADSCKVDTLVK